jgi:hypothetical protein
VSLLGVLGVMVLTPGVPALAGRATPTLPTGMPAAARARLASVTDNASITTQVDGEPFVARQDVFEFLVDHPEFASHVTQALRLARYRIWKTAEGLAIDDGWGTVGTFETVYAGRGVRVMYAKGEYHQKVLPNVRGQAVVRIDWNATPAADGKSTIAPIIAGFVKLDSRLVAFAGKLASSIATAKADKEAHRLAKVFAKSTRAIDANPTAVVEALRQRPDVPKRELEEFARLLSVPAAAAAPAAR